MLNKTAIIISICFIGLVTSCSENSTSPGSGSETDNKTDEQVVITGSIEVNTTTSGNTTDDDGFSVTVDDKSQSIGSDETVTFEDLEEGTYSVELGELANACSVNGDNPVTVDVTAGKTTTVNFDVVCEESTAEGTIVYSQRVDGVFELFSIHADGSNKQQITNSGRESSWVDISPDGTRIVFAKQNMTTTKYDIWVMDINGENPIQLTSGDFNDRHPSWSPDGTRIAFETERDGNFNIYLMDADGSNQAQLTTADTQDIQPDWAPVGDKIVFIKDDNDDGVNDIFVINVDGTGLEKMVEATSSNGINFFDPAWSPDATQIAYQGFSKTGGARMFITDANGSNTEMVTGSEVSAYQPTWSPDGNHIGFTNLASSNNSDEVWIIKSDGGSAQRLTTQDAYSAFPSWGITAE